MRFLSLYLCFVLALALAFCSRYALAQFNGCPPGFCNLSASSSPPATNFLLSDTGSALLVNTGSKFLVQ